jgi:hypothetical protein
VLIALLLPMLGLFSSTAGHAGDDLRKMEATNLALEVMDQVSHMHKRLGKLPGTPCGSAGADLLDREGWLDLDAYSRRFLSQQGVPLCVDVSRSAWNTRLFLAPAHPHYQRALKIHLLDTAPEHKNMIVDALVQARVRVRYIVPVAGRDVTREVLLVSNFFQKCRPGAQFRSIE